MTDLKLTTAEERDRRARTEKSTMQTLSDKHLASIEALIDERGITLSPAESRAMIDEIRRLRLSLASASEFLAKIANRRWWTWAVRRSKLSYTDRLWARINECQGNAQAWIKKNGGPTDERH